MSMTHDIKRGKDRFHFERGGFFGNGSKVKCYLNGEYVDEFHLDNTTLELMKDKNTSALAKQTMFHNECTNWVNEYGMDLIE